MNIKLEAIKKLGKKELIALSIIGIVLIFGIAGFNWLLASNSKQSQSPTIISEEKSGDVAGTSDIIQSSPSPNKSISPAPKTAPAKSSPSTINNPISPIPTFTPANVQNTYPTPSPFNTNSKNVGYQSNLDYEINKIIEEQRATCLAERDAATASLRSQLQSKYDEYDSIPAVITQKSAGKDISANQLARLISSKQSEILGQIHSIQTDIIGIELQHPCY